MIPWRGGEANCVGPARIVKGTPPPKEEKLNETIIGIVLDPPNGPSVVIATIPSGPPVGTRKGRATPRRWIDVLAVTFDRVNVTVPLNSTDVPCTRIMRQCHSAPVVVGGVATLLRDHVSRK